MRTSNYIDVAGPTDRDGRRISALFLRIRVCGRKKKAPHDGGWVGGKRKQGARNLKLIEEQTKLEADRNFNLFEMLGRDRRLRARTVSSLF